MKSKLLLSVGIMFLALNVLSQRATDFRKANYSFLKSVKKINVVFDYEGMTVGKNQTEEDYVAETVAEKNEKKAGAGDEWKEAWEKGKLNTYEPGFIEKFNKSTKKLGLVASQGDDAEMTVIVKITRLEPGFYSYAVNRNAAVDLVLSFVETADHEKIVSQVIMTNMQGNENPSVSGRVYGAFATAGAYLGKYAYKGLN